MRLRPDHDVSVALRNAFFTASADLRACADHITMAVSLPDMERLGFVADLPQETLAPGDALFILDSNRRTAVDHA